MNSDPEFRALRVILGELTKLTDEQVRRVMRFVSEKIADDRNIVEKDDVDE